MKRAQALSTICISLLACGWAAAPARAQVPGPDACFTRAYDAAHLARNPQQGVAGLRLWFHDAWVGDADSRSVIVEATMAQQGQALRDGVGGRVLQSTLFCGDAPGQVPGCFVECDGGGFTAELLADGRLELVTQGASIGLLETCGGHSDLSEGGRTVYRLDAAPPAACADLARLHPLPEPGCYGVAYARADAAGVIAALTLRLARPDLSGAAPAFPWLEGVMALDISPAATGMGDLSGARVMLPVWCGSDSGTCRSGADEGALAITLDGDEVTLESSHFLIFDPEGNAADITRGTRIRHVLSVLPDESCAALVLE